MAVCKLFLRAKQIEIAIWLSTFMDDEGINQWTWTEETKGAEIKTRDEQNEQKRRKKEKRAFYLINYSF